MRISDWSSDVCSSDLFFENQARKMAEAIETAAANLKPARMGATQIHHRVYKGTVVRLATAIDGTPAGYPLEYNDHGLVVMRFDDLSDPRSEEHTSELQSLMRTSYAVFCLTQKKHDEKHIQAH